MSFNQRHKAGRDIPEIFDGEVVILPLVKSTLMIMMNGFWWKQKRMLEKLKANAATRPLANWGGNWTNVVMTPFTFIGLGTPFGGQTDGTAGNLETIAAIGDGIHLTHFLGLDLDLIGVYGTRSGLGAAGGLFYGGGLNLTKKF